jgi:hypothetical protein
MDLVRRHYVVSYQLVSREIHFELFSDPELSRVTLAMDTRDRVYADARGNLMRICLIHLLYTL